MEVCMHDRGSWWWYRNGKLHREGDQPAAVMKDGTCWWYCDDKRHREGDKPAGILQDGTQEWWLHGEKHREGGRPAVVGADGEQQWWHNGLRHRDNGKPAVIETDGWQQWWEHGSMTRVQRVTNFHETSTRYALVRAVVCAGSAACDVVPGKGSTAAPHALLEAVQTACGSFDYHVGHEYAFLVALFL